MLKCISFLIFLILRALKIFYIYYFFIKTLKNNKSHGTDNISDESLKYCHESIIESIRTLCNNMFNSGNAINILKTNLIIPIPKKGDLSDMNNWARRG